MTTEHKQYVRQWLEKAEHDLIAAQVLIDVRPFILDVSCFHCQQAAEKFFKAFLIYKGADIQKTHDIVLLKKKCAELDIDFDVFDLKDLSEYAVSSRYPDSYIIPEFEEAKEYITLIQQIKKSVLNKIKL